MINRLFHEEAGILTFEWIMISVLLVIGLMAALAGARNAFVLKFSQTAQATASLKQSYTLPGMTATTTNLATQPITSETKESSFNRESSAVLKSTVTNVQ